MARDHKYACFVQFTERWCYSDRTVQREPNFPAAGHRGGSAWVKLVSVNPSITRNLLRHCCGFFSFKVPIVFFSDRMNLLGHTMTSCCSKYAGVA